MVSKLWLLSFSLVILGYILAQLVERHRQGPPITNNECIVYYDPDKVYTPSSLEEIQDIIQKARENGKTVRALGSGHCWNEMGVSNDIYISLHNYRGIVSTEIERKLVTVRAGTRLWELVEAINKHQLAFLALPSILNQTVGGAIATGTHGTGFDFGILSTFIMELELVTGTGEVLTLTADSDREIFDAAGVSLGLLGIITEVTFQFDDAFNLIEYRTTHPLSYCLDNVADLILPTEYVKFWIEINSKTCAVYSANRTEESPRDPIPQPITDIKIRSYEYLQWLWSIFTFTANAGMEILFNNVDVFYSYERVDESFKILTIPHYIDSYHRESEIVVHVDHCVDAINDLIEVKEKFNIPMNHIFEVRFAQGDAYWLSTNYKRDSCHITQLFYNPNEYYYNLYTDGFFNATRKYKGRPHWGKTFNMSPEEAHRLYPKLKKFLEIRKKLDPDGIFLNEFVKKTFGL